VRRLRPSGRAPGEVSPQRAGLAPAIARYQAPGWVEVPPPAVDSARANIRRMLDPGYPDSADA